MRPNTGAYTSLRHDEHDARILFFLSSSAIVFVYVCVAQGNRKVGRRRQPFRSLGGLLCPCSCWMSRHSRYQASASCNGVGQPGRGEAVRGGAWRESEARGGAWASGRPVRGGGGAAAAGPRRKQTTWRRRRPLAPCRPVAPASWLRAARHSALGGGCRAPWRARASARRVGPGAGRPRPRGRPCGGATARR